MKNILAFILIILAFASCKTTQPAAVVEVPIQYKEKIVERLVPVTVPTDSSSIFALFECDSTNKVILKQLDEEKTRRIQSLFTFNAGQMKYKTLTVHDTVYVPVKDTSVSKDVPVRVEVPIITNKLTRWQIGQIHIGRLFLTLLMGYGFYRLAKWKLKLF